ncbi:hypothetical protein LTR53_015653, partial [Teratosphaeriaceae sp. CCFEE 6253]
MPPLIRPQQRAVDIVNCSGCGAHHQTSDPNSAGYYPIHSPATAKRRKTAEAEDALYQSLLPSLAAHD